MAYVFSRGKPYQFYIPLTVYILASVAGDFTLFPYIRDPLLLFGVLALVDDDSTFFQLFFRARLKTYRSEHSREVYSSR